jgi:hypothetical protein
MTNLRISDKAWSVSRRNEEGYFKNIEKTKKETQLELKAR